MIGKIKGFMAGFLVGVFVAPRSGRASRRLLMERINEFFEMGSRQLDSLEEELAGRRGAPESAWPEVDETLSEHPLEEES